MRGIPYIKKAVLLADKGKILEGLESLIGITREDHAVIDGGDFITSS